MQFCILIVQNNPKSNITINRLFFFFTFAPNLYHTIEHNILAAINKIKIFTTTTTAIQNILSNIPKRDFTTLLYFTFLPKLKSHVHISLHYS